ncbi:UNVERIFIED_ORG: hypothetical protein GGD58_005644 [Rhizobium pisi]
MQSCVGTRKQRRQSTKPNTHLAVLAAGVPPPSVVLGLDPRTHDRKHHVRVITHKKTGHAARFRISSNGLPAQLTRAAARRRSLTGW